MLEQVIETGAAIIDVAGVAIIFGGVGLGLAGFVSIPFSRDARANMFQTIARLRRQVGTYILFGLEILIASDIAQTVIEPTYERLIVLGAIVIIRTLLSFFLSRELESLAPVASPAK